MLKLALCGSVKDNLVPAMNLADYLLFRINLHNPSLYSEYSEPTNDILQLLEAMARKTGRLQRGGTPDLEGTSLWMIQRWRNGHLGVFTLDEVSEEALKRYDDKSLVTSSLNQARKAGKEALKVRAKAKYAASASV
jgi:ribosome biogenesis GTPase A